MSNAKIKILVFGAINGNIPGFLKKLNSLHGGKAGPFDVCFCVGTFFGDDTHKDVELLNNATLTVPVYLANDAGVPPPTDGDEIELDDEEGEVSTSATSGVENGEATQPAGIQRISKFVYCFSHPEPDIYTLPLTTADGSVAAKTMVVAHAPSHVRLTPNSPTPLQLKAQHSAYIGCDVFLTNEWGQNVVSCFTTPDSNRVIAANPIEAGGSCDVSELACVAKPRYHFVPAVSVSVDTERGGYAVSLPFRNPLRLTSAGVGSGTHVCRFISMSDYHPTKGKKEFKYVHAIGIQTLTGLSRSELEEIPAGTRPSPYEESPVRGNQIMSDSHARTILRSEHAEQTQQADYQQQYRWNDTRNPNQKREEQRQRQQAQQEASSRDPTNKCLFLHGLHHDSANRLNPGTILEFFKVHECVKVRFPPLRNNNHHQNNKGPSFGFVEFESHDLAQKCLEVLGNDIVVQDVNLTLKWSSGGNAGGGTGGPPPPPSTPNPFVVPPPPNGPRPPPNSNPFVPPPPPRRSRNSRLTEADAKDSTSLFVMLDRNRNRDYSHADFEGKDNYGPASVTNEKQKPKQPETFSEALERLRTTAQMILEDAINADADTVVPEPTDGSSEETNSKTNPTEATEAQGEPAAKTAESTVESVDKSEPTETAEKPNQSDKPTPDEDKSADTPKSSPTAVCPPTTTTEPKPAGSRITDGTEPALVVTMRQPDVNKTYGFMGFASHAAASMAIASLTGSTDGGLVAFATPKKALSDSNIETQVTNDKQNGTNADVTDVTKPPPYDTTQMRGISVFWAQSNKRPRNEDNSNDQFKRRKHECWFCLASSTCEQHLILDVYKTCYLAMPRGPMDPFHSLIVPVAHQQSKDAPIGTLSLDSDTRHEIRGTIEKIRLHARKVLGKGLYVFERAIPPPQLGFNRVYHAHLQCIPVEDSWSMYEVFLEMSKALCGGKGGLFEDAKDYDEIDRILAAATSDGDKYATATTDAHVSVTGTDGAKDVSISSPCIPCVNNNKGYFYAEIPTGDGVEFRRLIYAVGSNNEHDHTLLPIHFGREVVANAMGDVFKGNWNNCVTDVPTETELANKFRISLMENGDKSEAMETK